MEINQADSIYSPINLCSSKHLLTRIDYDATVDISPNNMF